MNKIVVFARFPFFSIQSVSLLYGCVSVCSGFESKEKCFLEENEKKKQQLKPYRMPDERKNVFLNYSSIQRNPKNLVFWMSIM